MAPFVVRRVCAVAVGRNDRSAGRKPGARSVARRNGRRPTRRRKPTTIKVTRTHPPTERIAVKTPCEGKDVSPRWSGRGAGGDAREFARLRRSGRRPRSLGHWSSTNSPRGAGLPERCRPVRRRAKSSANSPARRRADVRLEGPDPDPRPMGRTTNSTSMPGLEDRRRAARARRNWKRSRPHGHRTDLPVDSRRACARKPISHQNEHHEDDSSKRIAAGSALRRALRLRRRAAGLLAPAWRANHHRRQGRQHQDPPSAKAWSWTTETKAAIIAMDATAIGGIGDVDDDFAELSGSRRNWHLAGCSG